MTEFERLKKGLARFLPEEALHDVSRYLYKEPIQLTIAKPRLTKLGDYRPPHRKNYHRISVNADLNKYHFLWTLVHEIAHFETFRRYENYVKPHGQEWQSCFSKLIEPFILLDIFPDEISPLLIKHIDRPKASSCSDPDIYKAFSSLNLVKSTFLDDLPLGCIFKFGNHLYRKGQKRRTRYSCVKVDSNVDYLIHGIAEVELVQLRQAY